MRGFRGISVPLLGTYLVSRRHDPRRSATRSACVSCAALLCKPRRTFPTSLALYRRLRGRSESLPRSRVRWLWTFPKKPGLLATAPWPRLDPVVAKLVPKRDGPTLARPRDERAAALLPAQTTFPLP